MKPRPVLALLALAASAATAGLFDMEQVSEVRLEFAQPNWDEILDSLYAAGEEGRLIGTCFVNGARFDSVGVRYKGYSSYNPSRRKNPFNIKLDEVRTEQAIEGHGTLRLANVYKDPSFVREALGYEIARMYMPAGRASFADVYVNDTLIGLYTNDEDPDQSFMRRFYQCDENARFKARVRFDSVAMVGWKYLGPDSTPYLDYFELESDSGWRELIGLFDTLSNHNEALDLVLNVDQHLWMLAFDILLVNLDAPVNTPQNHYLYRDASGRFCPNVWDLNESFGAFRDLQGTGQLSVAQMQQLDPFLRASDSEYPICSRVLPDARRRRMYVAHMKTMIADVLADNWYRDRAYEIQDIIDAHVRADPNKFYSYNDFTINVSRSVGSGPLAIVGLSELMATRASWLLSRPEFLAQAPLIAAVRGEPARGVPGSAVRILARVTGADSAWVGLRQSAGLRFTKYAMRDDGTGGDEVAGDSVWTATVALGAGDADYYVYAENSAAGSFDPPRAEHEYFTLPVGGDIVINEVLALNQTVARDPAGEFDDYIELHNNSGAPVSLDGWLLTDDTLDPVRWSFPDTGLAAGGYLIVWADGDTGQQGLHAGFRLSGDGDMVLLSDPDGARIDRVVFGPQAVDVSYGRYPDGLGAFRLMNPTFGAENDSGVGIAEPTVESAICRLERAVPNPFARSTVIRYALTTRSEVSLAVYDATGRQVAQLAGGCREAGSHEAVFAPDARTRPAAGVLFARLIARPLAGVAETQTMKLVLAR